MRADTLIVIDGANCEGSFGESSRATYLQRIPNTCRPGLLQLSHILPRRVHTVCTSPLRGRSRKLALLYTNSMRAALTLVDAMQIQARQDRSTPQQSQISNATSSIVHAVVGPRAPVALLRLQHQHLPEFAPGDPRLHDLAGQIGQALAKKPLPNLTQTVTIAHAQQASMTDFLYALES